MFSFSIVYSVRNTRHCRKSLFQHHKPAFVVRNLVDLLRHVLSLPAYGIRRSPISAEKAGDAQTHNPKDVPSGWVHLGHTVAGRHGLILFVAFFSIRGRNSMMAQRSLNPLDIGSQSLKLDVVSNRMSDNRSDECSNQNIVNRKAHLAVPCGFCATCKSTAGRKFGEFSTFVP